MRAAWKRVRGTLRNSRARHMRNTEQLPRKRRAAGASTRRSHRRPEGLDQLRVEPRHSLTVFCSKGETVTQNNSPGDL